MTILKLYVAGTDHRSENAITNLRRICERELRGDYEVEVIDVLSDPEAAEQLGIVATPTLIRLLPPPLRRVIGDLSNTQNVMLGLSLAHR